ncbi:MAG: M28 family peptidase [Solirubrobacterales bacterium]|nr:M28 family peptidase [Solirubrobacterales bacterium]MBV9915425.1 M28 family peptidase [Solirubrobacterales bacterium]
MPAQQQTLREVIEALALLERRAGSPGEEQAARWIAERLARTGCEVEVDEERFHDGYARVLGTLSASATLAGVAALGRRSRKLGAAVAAAVVAAIADDVSNGPRLFRRATAPLRTTWNVVARCGDPSAERTLVVLAHHDAAPTGAIFNDTAQAWFGERFPGVIERIDTSLPVWWALLSMPALIAIGGLREHRGMVALGLAGSIVGTAVLADVARRPVCPGANDNLTAVAVLVALAERLRDQPLEGLRLLLVSCGAEEVLQGGIHGFAARHFPALDREKTWFLNLDTVGSPKLILLEGEGPVVMEDYHDRTFRDLVGRAAERAGAPVRRGMRSRTSTDAVIPSRAGYPTTTITSMDRYKALSNYHKVSDTPQNVDYGTVARALTLAEAVARDLAAEGRGD